MKLIVLINEKAGSVIGQDQSAIVDVIKRGLTAAGHDVTISWVEPKTLDEGIKKAIASEQYDAVIVGGGDGSIRSAVSIAVHHDVPLGFIPLGTLNLLARDLGIPIDLDGAVSALANGAVKRIDVAEVNGIFYVCNSLIGLPIRHAVERQRLRGRGLWGGLFDYMRSVRTLLASRHRLSITIDDGTDTRTVRVISAAVTNNAYDQDQSFNLVRTRLDAGHLTVYLSKHRNGWAMIGAFLRIFAGRWHGDPLFETVTARSVQIFSRSRYMRVSNDGEVARLRSPLNYKIHSKRLQVISPNADANDVTSTSPTTSDDAINLLGRQQNAGDPSSFAKTG